MTDENQPPSGASVPPQPPVPPVPPAPPAAPQHQAPPPPAAPAAPQYQAAPPPPAAPAYQGQPQPAYGAAAAPVPGKTLGIVGLIVSIAGFFIFPLVAPIAGLIISIIASRQSKAAGVPNGPAKAGIIISIIAIVLEIIGVIILIVVLATLGSAVVEACADLGPGQHIVDGITYTCS